VLKTKARADVQVKISGAVANKYHLRAGEKLDAHELDGCIVFIPKRIKNNRKLSKKLNKIFWSYLEQEAEDDIKAGRVAGPFETVEELLRDLKK
jgi:hypothetical protein